MTGATGESAFDALEPARRSGSLLAGWLEANPALFGSAALVGIATLSALHTAGYDHDVALVVLQELGLSRLLLGAVVSLIPFVSFAASGLFLVLASARPRLRLTYLVVSGAFGVVFVLAAPLWAVVVAVPVFVLAGWTGWRSDDTEDVDVPPNWVLVPILFALTLVWQAVTTPVVPLEALDLGDGGVLVVGRVLNERDGQLLVLADGELHRLGSDTVESRRLCPHPWPLQALPRALAVTAAEPCR